jgi:peptidoglycan/xylan/chitin deacetylase (PgdA/CDA1 family)
MHIARVLAYHSGNISGNDYATNNLVALAHDLEILRIEGFSILPLRQLVDALVSRKWDSLPARSVAITCDDGLDYDFLELQHPFQGRQRSIRSILVDAARLFGYGLHATSFVIASPEARRQIADREMLGYRWMNDSWWRDATQSDLFHIGNHSWDHVSASVESASADPACRGSSKFIDNLEAANLQVVCAHDYIERLAPNPGTCLFAYPFGDFSRYLAEEYFPKHQDSHHTIAAFTTEPAVITDWSNRWLLPRYVCGVHWNSQEDFQALLRAT